MRSLYYEPELLTLTGVDWHVSRVLSLPAADTRQSHDLFHPRRDLAFVQVFHGFEFHAPRRLAHRHRRHGRHRVSVTPFTNMSLT